jgi:hypothetical protein
MIKSLISNKLRYNRNETQSEYKHAENIIFVTKLKTDSHNIARQHKIEFTVDVSFFN